MHPRRLNFADISCRQIRLAARNKCMNLPTPPRIDQATDGSKNPSRQASIIVWDASPLSLLTLAGVLDTQGYRCVCARSSESALQTLEMGRQDLLVCDVGDDAAMTLETIEKIRAVPSYERFPAVMLADACWAGLEKKAEASFQPTRCLFKPIDPNSLIAVVDQVLWMPALVSSHRRRGSRPSRPGWVSL